MINKITEKDYPEFWDLFIEEMDDATSRDHRRGGSFYITPRYRIDIGYLELPHEMDELSGLWEADTRTWSDDWGLDSEPTTLYRIEEREKVVKTVVKEYFRV